MKRYDAELHKVSKITVDGKSWLQGVVFKDSHTHGNHPFRDGSAITTSKIEGEYCDESGNKFITTRNTVYRIFGKVKNVNYD